jgi:hypothetical protein
MYRCLLDCQTKVKWSTTFIQWICTWMSPSRVTASLAKKQALWRLPRILGTGTSEGANNGILLLLRLMTHQRWLPLHCHTHQKCFTTFICYGCAHGWVLLILLRVLLAKPLELPRILVTSQGATKRIVLWLRLSHYWGNEFLLWWKFASREQPLRRKIHNQFQRSSTI